MPNSIHSLFFPETFRHVPHRRLILNVLRSAHLLSISILLGGFFFHIDKAMLTSWLVAVIVSGLSMFMVDLYESCDALLEVRGASVLLKISLLLSIPLFSYEKQIFILIVVIIFSSFISHGSKRFRHKKLLPAALQPASGTRTKNRNRVKTK